MLDQTFGFPANTDRQVFDWFPTEQIQDKISINGLTTLRTYGDSITAGQNAPLTSERYTNQMSDSLVMTLVNNGLAGTRVTYPTQVLNSQALTAAAKKTSLYTCMIGTNDLTFANTNPKKFEACTRSFIHKIVSNSLIAAGSASVTRVGTHTAFNCQAVAGINGSATIPGNTGTSSASAEVCSWTWTNGGTPFTRFGLSFIANGTDGSYGTANVYIDSVLVYTVNFNSWGDTYAEKVPIAWTFHGLSNASHTIKVETNGDGIVTMDCFATVHEPENAGAFLIAEIPILTSQPFLVQAQKDIMQSFDDAKKVVYDEYKKLNYNTAYIFTRRYMTKSGIGSDFLHPIALGHDQITNAFMAAIGIENVFNNSGYYGINQ